MSSRESLTRLALYLQVSGLLAERIAGGTWRPGGLLPNESDLAREFGVSAGTMRKALDKLEADRFIERRQGKGTFVLDHTVDELAFRFSRIVDESGHRVGDRRSTLLSQEIGPATSLERNHLELGARDEIVRTHRLREHKGLPCKHETTCLALKRFGIKCVDEVGDYTIVPLAQKHGIHLARGVEKISAAPASSKLANLLRVQRGKMLLKLDRLIYSTDGQPVEWRVALCNLQDAYYLVEMT